MPYEISETTMREIIRSTRLPINVTEKNNIIGAIVKLYIENHELKGTMVDREGKKKEMTMIIE